MSGGSMGPAGTVLAEPWKRIVALLIDAVILGVIRWILLFVVAAASSTNDSVTGLGVSSGLTLVIYIVWALLAVAYFGFMISATGTTVGGMILKLKVVGTDGSPVTQQQAFKRAAVWALPAIDFLCCLGSLALLVLEIWGLVNLFNDPSRQTPWDKFGETIVVDA